MMADNLDEFEFDNGDKFNFKLAIILNTIVHENTCHCCPHDIGIKLAREADKFYRQAKQFPVGAKCSYCGQRVKLDKKTGKHLCCNMDKYDYMNSTYTGS